MLAPAVFIQLLSLEEHEEEKKRETKIPAHQGNFASPGLKLYVCKRDASVPISADIH